MLSEMWSPLMRLWMSELCNMSTSSSWPHSRVIVCLSHDQIKRPNSSPALFQPLECLQERWIRLRSNWLPDWDSATVCEHHRAAFRGVMHSLALMTDRETWHHPSILQTVPWWKRSFGDKMPFLEQNIWWCFYWCGKIVLICFNNDINQT